MVACKRQFLTAAGAGAVDGRNKPQAGIVCGIFDTVTGLIREFTKIDLVRVGRLGQHPDISTGAEYPRLVGRNNHSADLGMLEPQTLNGVIKLDINTEVVRIKFQLVAWKERRVLIYIKRKTGDTAVNG